MSDQLAVMLIFFGGFAIGVMVAFPSETARNNLMEQGSIAVYEHRAVCEKALDQWVCNLPKE